MALVPIKKFEASILAAWWQVEMAEMPKTWSRQFLVLGMLGACLVAGTMLENGRYLFLLGAYILNGSTQGS
jgi:hypothetical protein